MRRSKIIFSTVGLVGTLMLAGAASGDKPDPAGLQARVEQLEAQVSSRLDCDRLGDELGVTLTPCGGALTPQGTPAYCITASTVSADPFLKHDEAATECHLRGMRLCYADELCGATAGADTFVCSGPVPPAGASYHVNAGSPRSVIGPAPGVVAYFAALLDDPCLSRFSVLSNENFSAEATCCVD